jgi:DnaK suppressor protein
MTRQQKEAIKEKIIKDLSCVDKEIQDLQTLCKPISPECALGDLARFELMHEQVISEKTLDQALKRQKRLEYALRKVETQDYGLCIECEEEIAYERLLLVPESTHCIKCASEHSS